MDWRPNPGPQAELFKRDEFEIFYGGARGGGKTDAIIMDHLRGIKHKNYRGLILRRTFPELREIIDRSIKYFSKIRDTNGKILKPKYNSTEHVWAFPSGAKVEFGSMVHEDSKLHYIGREFTKISFDQLEQFTESQYLYMMGQVRTTCPHVEHLLGMMSTGNPGGPGHSWVKARFIDKKEPYKTYKQEIETDLGVIAIDSVYIPAKVYDNPILTEINPQYVAVLSSLPKDLKAAWLDGDWSIFVGQFFGEFRSDIHAVVPFEIPVEGYEIFGGLDYGEFNQTSFGLYAIGYDGILYRVAEYYSPGGADQHARMIIQTIKECKWTQGRPPRYIFADPTMWTRRKLDIAVSISAYQTLYSYGLTQLVRASNDRIQGWREVKRRLHWEMNDKGNYIIQPTFFYFDGCCPDFERTLPSCVYPPNAKEKNVEDMDKKGEDHAADEFRYLCMGVRPPDLIQPEAIPVPQDAHHIGHRMRREREHRITGGQGPGSIIKTYGDLE